MSISKWQPGTLYLAGALVVPSTVASAGATATAIPNADFESGDSDWTKGTGWAINGNQPWGGSFSAEFTGNGTDDIISSTKVSVAPGKAISAHCYVRRGSASSPNAAVLLQWYDGADAPLSQSIGEAVTTGAEGTWKQSTVTAVAPPSAAKVAIGAIATSDGSALYVDNFNWDYVSGVASTGLVYKATFASVTDETPPETPSSVSYTGTDISFEGGAIRRASGSWLADGFNAAMWVTISGSSFNDGDRNISSAAAAGLYLYGGVVAESAGASITVSKYTSGGATPSEPAETQATSGTSGATEPDWPTGVGGTVVDNDIVWEAVSAGSVTWEASSVLTSGSTEPTWPEEAESYISDNNIAWKATPLRITDELCPHTKVVAIAGSKVFAAGKDGNVVRFCATLNARDWSTPDDAGFLPTGQQQKSQVGVDVMNVYRSNLVVWSGSNLQVWQIDPDPTAMQLLDSMEGIGSTYQQAAQPIADDLFFLAALGVRTVSVAAGAENLATGDVGKPIDTLIQAELGVDVEPHATYYPSAGQYWLAFRNVAAVLTIAAGEFFLTSPPYPLEAEDAMQSSALPDRGRIVNRVEDGFESSATPLSGTLETVLRTYTHPDEAIETAATPLGGEFSGDVIEYTAEEAISTSATPLDSLLDAVLIVYTHPDEAIETSATPLDSTLEDG